MLLRQINALACTVLNLTRENITFARLTCYERFYLRDRSLFIPWGGGGQRILVVSRENLPDPLEAL